MVGSEGQPDRADLTFRQSRLQWDQPPREGESGQVSKPSHLVFSLSLTIFVSSRRGAPQTRSYEEGAINGNMGPVGAEWTSQKGQTQPSFGIDLPIGDAQVQPGQVMAGITNPLGPGGLRVGFDFHPESVQTFVTTRGYLDSTGGVSAFSTAYASEGARLWRMAYVRGTCVQGLGCFSGIEYTRWLLYNTGNPYAEVPQ